MDNADFMNGSYISIPASVCKSIPGTEDKDGNYTFEVEASNENLDLQNQKILQSALLNSKEYFLTNGVVSDDHQHKVRKDDGSVETNKDKIIGEPVSVRTDGKKTFVKGILYGAVEAAKPFINLLKAHSSRVKASVGGIMPQVRKNADGSETVTGFMWNDLALTCSPVNWTVGSARFAKSMSTVDFCKALSAGTGTDCAEYSDGRALQKEDVEKQTKKILDFPDDEEQIDFSKDDEIKKSEESIINEALICIDTGELKTRTDIEQFFMENGFDKNKARDKTLEIIRNGGKEMKKSHFSETINDLLKSLDSDKDAEKDVKTDSEEEESLFSDDELEDDSDDEDSDEDDSDDEDSDEDDSDDEEDSDKDVKKSGTEDFIDGTKLLGAMRRDYEDLKKENSDLKKSLDEVKESLVSVTKSFSEYLKSPAEARKSVIEKSIGGNYSGTTGKRPTGADFDILKSALVKESKSGKIGLEQVQFYNSEFQKAMNGQKINPQVWSEICRIVRDNR